MPPLILSLALLLLLLLALLALSNQGMVALSFLGLRSLELPLAIWMAGAIALGFLLGIWLLLLLRLGLGKPRGQGPRWRGQNGRQMAYGPEDFTVVADGYGSEVYGGEANANANYADSGYADPAYVAEAYDNRTWGEPVYADPADQEQTYTWSRREAPSGYAEPGGGDDRYRQSDGRQPYDRDRSASDDSRGEQSPRDRWAEPGERYGDQGYPASEPTAAGLEHGQGGEGSRSAVPPDWNDEYREQWSEEELWATESPGMDPVLIENRPAPRLKRWFTKQVEERNRRNPSDNEVPDDSDEVDGAAENDWGDRRRAPDASAVDQESPAGAYPRGDVRDGESAQRPSSIYDVDYRLVQPSDPVDATENWRDRPQPSPAPPPAQQAPPSRSNQPSNEDDDWDIDRDLDW